MKKTLSTRDALLLLRNVVSADAEKGNKIRELSDRLNVAIAERAGAVGRALGALEGYADLHTRLHGFNDGLEVVETTSRPAKEAVAATSRPTSASTGNSSKKKKGSKRRKKARVKRSSRKGGQSLQTTTIMSGWQGKLANSISLSKSEQDVVDILTQGWPAFTTPKMFAKKGAIGNSTVASATINRLRDKGVPVESARQVREKDPTVSTQARGYRLIG